MPCELLISCQLQLSDAADADKQVVSFQERFEMVPADALTDGPATVSKTQAFVTQVSALWHSSVNGASALSFLLCSHRLCVCRNRYSQHLRVYQVIKASTQS